MPKKPLLPLDDALAAVLEPLVPTPSEWIGLSEGDGRVLAEAVPARRTLPAEPVSAMDGYAVRAADCGAAGVELAVTGRIEAGGAPTAPLEAGAARRIFTGGTVPPGADAIVIQEDTEVLDGNRIRITEAARPNAHIRAKGLDFETGSTLLSAGTRLDGRHLSLAAAGDATWLSVRRKPKIAILATGSELARPGTGAAPHRVVASSGFGLAPAVARWGGEPVDLGLSPDRMEDLLAGIARAQGADLLITLGGASVGEPDLVKSALAEAGYRERFWKVAMKPGKPVFFGHLDAMPVLGLPGNPVSALVTALVFVRPALAALLGTNAELPRKAAFAAVDLPENGPRADFMRATTKLNQNGKLLAEPLAKQDSSMLSFLAKADALLFRAPGAPSAPAGTPVEVISLAEAMAF